MLDQSKYTKLLERARKRFQRAVDAESDIRREAQVDLDYLSGSQWNARVKMEREKGPSPRPCLVFNKVLPPVTQLCNQGRQNKPAIVVNPVNSAADPDTAKVQQGLIRHIEYDSDADQAYDTALFYAAGCSFGYWRYGCEYTDNESFDQDIKTILVDDPFSIYLDCDARKLDRSDAQWGFVLDKLANETFTERFGEDPDDLSAEFVGELGAEGWRDGDSKRVAEYWEVEKVKKTLRMRKAEDGTLHKEYLEDMRTDDEDQEVPENGRIPQRAMTRDEIEALEWELDQEGQPKERTVEIPEVWQYIINGARVLEEPTRWDGSTIPIVMITGLEVIVRGKKKIFSMTRFARDPQQLLNFYKTMEAEAIALAPKPKFVGAVGQFRTKKRDWQRANVDNAAYLEYDMVAIGDRLAPEPQWRTFDPPVQALSIGAAAAADDIKASTGYFDPSLGQVKGDQSGVAIGKLQRQGDVSNFHFMDNWGRGLKRGGRIILELIPHKYDTEREIRIIGEDQKQRIVKVNAAFQDENGKWKHHKLDVGKYDCRCDMGGSYQSQRIETRELITALAQGNPQVFQLAADIFFENCDFIGADRLAKRFKAALPPQIAAADEAGGEDGQPAIPQAAQAQIQQLQMATQQLQMQNQQLMTMLGTKILELESRERIATQANLTKIQVAEAGSKNATVNQLFAQEHSAAQAELERRAQLLHSTLDIQADAYADQQEAQQEQQQAAQQRQHDAQQQRAQQQHQGALQGMSQQHDAAQAELDRQHALAQQQQQQQQLPQES